LSFLADRTQTVKVGDKISCQRFINRGIQLLRCWCKHCLVYWQQTLYAGTN